MNRPMGVTILGWVAIVFGAIGLITSIFGVIAAIGLMALGAGAAGLGGVAGGAALAGSALLLIILAIWTALLCAVEVAFGVGALGLKPWAWQIGIIWTYISVATNLVSVIVNRGSGIVGALVGILVAIVILYYLFTEEVRAAFGKLDQQPPSFLVPVFTQIDQLVAGQRGGAAPGAYAPPQQPAPGAYAPPAPPAAPGGYAPPAAPPAPPAPPAAPQPPVPPAPPA